MAKKTRKARAPAGKAATPAEPKGRPAPGVKAADIVGRTCLELFPKAEPEWFERYGKVALTGEPANFEGAFGPLGWWFEVGAFRTEPGRFAVMFMDMTERKRVEDALRESEQRYRTLFDSMQEGFYVGQTLFDDAGTPCDFTYVTTNPAFERIMGLRRDQVVGHRGKELVPEINPGWLETFSKVQATGEPARFDSYSEQFHKHFEAFIFRPAQGQFAVLVTDITDRKHAEEALRASEERFRSIVANMSEGLMLFDAQGIIYQNPASLRIHGWQGPEDKRIEHKEWPSTWKGWDQSGRPLPFEEWPISRVLRNECFEDQVLRVVRVETGHEFWASYNGYSILGADGKLTLGFITIRDITERKGAEETLQTTLQRFYAVLSSMYSGILLVTDDGRVEFTNQAFCDRFGLTDTPVDLVGLAAPDMIAKIKKGYLHPDEAVIRIREIVDRGQPVKGEELAMHGGGTCLRDYVPLRVRGKSYGRLWIHFDITDRKRAETELKEANDELAKAAKELARSNEDLEQFARVASHDLQEPLRMVSGFMKLLQERYDPQLDDKGKEYIGYAVEGATRMSQLITDLLAYSRVGSKGKELRPIRAGDALATALANLRGSMQDAGATVTHDDLPTVNGDATQLAQLFQNLIGNAIKFRGPDRPCRVHISAEKKNGQWVLSVRDNGIGIAQEFFDRVFVIFQRLHTREEYAGTGIGLAICKKIVERHGGRIWVDSTPGEGSTFYFTMPMTGAAPQAGEQRGEAHE